MISFRLSAILEITIFRCLSFERSLVYVIIFNKLNLALWSNYINTGGGGMPEFSE